MATKTLPAAERTSKAGTTLFLKTLMAVSGVVFVLFVFAHMAGNLKIIQGEQAFNTYAEHIRTIGEPILPYAGLLWILRVGLIVSLVAHVGSAAVLSARASKARPVKYEVKKNPASTPSSRTMRWGGLALLLFVIFHLLQFTNPKLNFGDGQTQNPFQLVVGSFEVWWVTAIYLAAMVALGLHLHHGVWSACQTLGLTSTLKSRRIAKTAGAVVALVITIGFLIPPLLVQFDVIN